MAGEESVDVILGLENLVAQSLLQVEADTRMTMGPALRQFATVQLMRGPRQRELLNSLSRDWHNFRFAGESALSLDHVDLAGRLYTNIWILSWQGDNWDESESFTRRLAPLMDRLQEPIRARAQFIAAGT